MAADQQRLLRLTLLDEQLPRLAVTASLSAHEDHTQGKRKRQWNSHENCPLP